MSIVACTLAMLATLTMASMCVFTTAVLAPAAAPDLSLDAKFIGPFMTLAVFAVVGAIVVLGASGPRHSSLRRGQ